MTCPRCFGTGVYVYMRHKEHKCLRCNGTGKVKEKK